MYKWLGTHPMVVILLPLIVLLVVLDSLQIPIHPYHKPIVALPDSVQTYQLVTQTYPSEHKKTWRVEASIISPQYHPTHPPHVYLYIHKDSSLVLPSLQDTLMVHTRFQSADTIGTFDYNRYLQHQGICAIGFVDSQHWFIHNACTSNRWHPKAWQYQLHQYLQSLGIQGAELGTLSALTLGYKEDLEPDIQRSFSAAGATHVLAVSGLHTGILYTIIIMFLTGMGRWRPLYEEKWKRRVLSLCVIICLVLYALLTGATPSVIRSVIMLSLVEIGGMFYRKTNSINTLAAAAWIILVLFPADLFSVSFQLSFAAVWGILVLEPYLRNIVPMPKTQTKIGYNVKSYLQGLISVSLAAQISTLPIALYYFGQMSNYFLLTNLIVIPLGWLIIVGAIIMLLLSPFGSIGVWLSYVPETLTHCMNQATLCIESLPYSTTHLECSFLMLCLLYGAILAAYLSKRHNIRWLGVMIICLISFCISYLL